MRRIFSWNTAAIAAFVLCALSAVAWPWSYRQVNSLQFNSINVSVGPFIYRGAFGFTLQTGDDSDYFTWHHGRAYPDPAIDSILNFLWFSQGNSHAIGMPLWLCAILFGYLGVRARRRARKPEPGFCHVCGYDLRATPDRCPECGAVPAKTAIAG
jgi:hypothetical protein